MDCLIGRFFKQSKRYILHFLQPESDSAISIYDLLDRAGIRLGQTVSVVLGDEKLSVQTTEAGDKEILEHKILDFCRNLFCNPRYLIGAEIKISYENKNPIVGTITEVNREAKTGNCTFSVHCYDEIRACGLATLLWDNPISLDITKVTEPALV